MEESANNNAIAATAASLGERISASEGAAGNAGINHSVCRWCYDDIPLEVFCAAAKEIGLQSIELLETSDFATLEKFGLTCAMVTFPTTTTKDGVKCGMIEKAFNRTEHHDALVEVYEKTLNDCAAVGAKQLICFAGNREGMDDEQGLENCSNGLKRILPLAEKLGITLSMELLNSRVDHPDYMCDRSSWGTALVDRTASPNFKLLYDIYHMQVMEGDVIATILAKHEYFSHYHTGGVPGRNEIDETQELYYPAIMRAIVDTGYTGYVGQEFIPKNPDKLASLKQGVGICTV
ncbi:MAG: TIM barrel protein [Verrucomicrobia bacterium]|jgi:hydroxypyruvate isomerase|nr:TIM barrel protein [Verrucomicrobiota bacterium]|tara:strand:+ start:12287 stop:13162 length:876 start_codon:yes stop_codon:yes gene_type:complete